MPTVGLLIAHGRTGSTTESRRKTEKPYKKTKVLRQEVNGIEEIGGACKAMSESGYTVR